MGKIDQVKAVYLARGFSEDNIDYAISAVKSGSKREHIMENLCSDYRRMQPVEATALMESLFEANGGEFKKENRGGYLYASLMLLLGLGCAYYLYEVYTNGGILIRPVLIWTGAVMGTGAGIILLLKTIFGKFRESDIERDRDQLH
jgi:hypothetical protein